MSDPKIHRSGYVNIIGRPNVGKSTLMNALLGEKMAIITPKAQTTRHRIIGIYSEEDHQIIFSDTPGLIKDPKYKMQEAMNKAAFSIFEDADVILLMIEPGTDLSPEDKVFSSLKKATAPVFLLINKIDTSEATALTELAQEWSQFYEFENIIMISATEKHGIDHLLQEIKQRLPEGPAYYPKDNISDRSTRFFVSEIIREKILLQYKQEIPYSSEVHVEEYKESIKNDKPFVHIKATIFVMRKTQKAIIIGQGGRAIKSLGIAARRDIEKFIDSRCHLELYVKVKEKWRDDERLLKSFGYLN